MKITSIVLAAASLCAGVASAFGLPSATTDALNKAAPFFSRGGAAVKQSPLVQPIDITGKRLSVSLHTASADAISTNGGASSAVKGIDIPLLIYFALWYLGNYYVSANVEVNVGKTEKQFPFPDASSIHQCFFISFFLNSTISPTS